MIEPFKGTVNVDIRDSVPDWSPFEPPWAPDGAPNVVYIVLDDVGFSALGCYGGPIETPNIDQIAERRGAVHAVAHHSAVLANPIRGGRPGRLGEREHFLQRDPGRPAAESGDDRRAGRAQDLQPLLQRLGDGVQHAVQDVEAV
jgi:hypothetical protein